MSNFRLVILTPEKEIFNGDIERVLVPTDRGSLTVLFRNYPVLSLLQTGIITVKKENLNQQTHYAISHGVMNSKRDTVYILGGAIERSDQIDVARALAAKERAEARIDKGLHGNNIDIQRAQAALNRALTRLKVSSIND